MTEATKQGGALAGVRVVDFTRMLSGPYCSMLLADQGAEVIKIEPAEGDTSRTTGPFLQDDVERRYSGYFQSVNRNKKSIVLDLKSAAAKEVVYRLVASSHVVVENFRPGVMDRLGFGYEALAEKNPAIVYAAIRGFGDPRSGEGPYMNWPAYDAVAQAMGGLMGITGPSADEPMKVGPGIGDIFPGTMTAFGILAALLHANKTGRGQFLDVCMYDAVLALCERIVYQFSIGQKSPVPEGSGHPLFAPFGNFRAADGWIAIAVPNDNFWGVLCRIMGKPELASDPRCESKAARGKNRSFINAVVGEWVASRSKAELAGLLGGHVPFGPVNTAEDVFADEHVRKRNMIVDLDMPGLSRPVQVANTPIRLEKTPGGVRARGPNLGEHTDTILSDLGYSPEEIRSMRQASAVQ